jgi:hypothetical protein
VAIALSGDVLCLVFIRREGHRWVWLVLFLLANAPLLVAMAQKAESALPIREAELKAGWMHGN